MDSVTQLALSTFISLLILAPLDVDPSDPCITTVAIATAEAELDDAVLHTKATHQHITAHCLSEGRGRPCEIL